MRISKEELQAEALSRAAGGESVANLPAIIEGFVAKGIPESDIKPRENVLTYHAWRAHGRQVRRGERGVKVMTWVADKPAEGADPEKAQPRKKPWYATVFHVSQTDPM